MYDKGSFCQGEGAEIELPDFLTSNLLPQSETSVLYPSSFLLSFPLIPQTVARAHTLHHMHATVCGFHSPA